MRCCFMGAKVDPSATSKPSRSSGKPSRPQALSSLSLDHKDSTTFQRACLQSVGVSVPHAAWLPPSRRYNSSVAGAAMQYASTCRKHHQCPGSSSRPSINRTPTQRTVRAMVKRYLEAITSKFWVKNTSTKMIHISGAPEFSTESIHWHTLRGWRYGHAPHAKFLVHPGGQPVPEMVPRAGQPGHHRQQQRRGQRSGTSRLGPLTSLRLVNTKSPTTTSLSIA